MKKRLLYVSAIVVIFVAAAVFAYKIYFRGTAVKEETPLLSQESSQPGPKIPKPGEDRGAGASGKAETKRPGMAPAGAAQRATERPAVAYEYNAKGRRDPFATLIVKKENEKRRGATPLESYDVSEFSVRGIFWNESAFYALVAAPDGKSYTVKEGTPIGLNHGKAYRITKDSVLVSEFVKDYRGTARPKNTVLKLHRGELL